MNITTHDGLLATIFNADEALLANMRLCCSITIGSHTYIAAKVMPYEAQAEMWLTTLAEKGYCCMQYDAFKDVDIDVKMHMLTTLANYDIDDGDAAALLDNSLDAIRGLDEQELKQLTIHCLEAGPEIATSFATYLKQNI